MAPKKTEKEEKVAITTSKTPAAKRVTPTESATAEKNVRLQSSNESAEAFLRKLKANRHEPLPKPQEPSGSSGRGWLLALVLLVALVGGGGTFAYYQGFLPTNLSFNLPFFGEQEEGENPAPAPSGGELEVRIASEQVSAGTAVDISVGLPQGTDGVAQLYLLDEAGDVVGFIGTVSDGQSSVEWNPQEVTRTDEEGNEYLQAPTEGSYRLLLAIRPQGDEREATQLAESTTSSSFTLSYDEVSRSGEIAFETCLNVEGYASETWHADFSEQAAQAGLDLDAVTVSCYSPQGEMLVLAASGEGLAEYPLVARFDVRSGLLRIAVYTDARTDESVQGAPATFGVRNGTTIPLIVNGAVTFSYDFIENTVESVE